MTTANVLPADLVRTVRIGVAWLDTDQPDGAIQSHHGITSMGAQWDGRVKVGVVPAGHAGRPVVVFDVANRQFSDDYLLINPFTQEEIDTLTSAVVDVASVVNSWNGVGTETFSVGFEHPLDPSLTAALKRYHDGCPKHRPKILCGWEPTNCPWYSTGNTLMVYPEGWRG